MKNKRVAVLAALALLVALRSFHVELPHHHSAAPPPAGTGTARDTARVSAALSAAVSSDASCTFSSVSVDANVTTKCARAEGAGTPATRPRPY